MKAVSLFDFDKADATTVLNQAWGNLSIQGAHSVVLIGINRNLIDPTKLQLPDEIRKEVFRLSISGHSSGLTHIPEIEILHFGEVPVATFCGFFLTDGVRRYSETPVGDGAATTLLALSEEWQRDDRKLTMERRARGEYSDAEIMTEIVLKSYTR